MLDINFVTTLSDHQTIVVFLNEKLQLDKNIKSLDNDCNGLISKTIKNTNTFSGKFAQSKVLTIATNNEQIKYIIMMGCGNESKLKSACIESLGGSALAIANAIKVTSFSLMLPDAIGAFTKNQVALLMSSGILLASYKFDKYLTKQKEEDKNSVTSAEVLVDDKKTVQLEFIRKTAVVNGVFAARDYISEPPNVLYPASYADRIERDLKSLNIKVSVYGEQDMRKLSMGALLGVGQGSQNESKLVVMEYKGTSNADIDVALVGKGVTFDSGGISLKPAANMWDMKYDMGGSAAVVGTMKALALRKANVNIVGIVGLVENMPSGNAQKPSDIVTTMSGQTAEVLNTDAEGRLVLADAIWYAQEKFKPKCVIDLATLTGAIVVALGHVYAGCFSNDDKLAQQLIDAGNEVDEKLWCMPLHSEYDKLLKSDIADVANITNGGGAGGSTAAHFISRFIKDKVQWAHLDIAGVAWEKKGTAICPKGAVGYGVRLLNKFIEDNYEV